MYSAVLLPGGGNRTASPSINGCAVALMNLGLDGIFLAEAANASGRRDESENRGPER